MRDLPAACRDCDHFSAPSSDRKKIEAVGGVWKGDCVLQPVAIKKSPDDRCGQHSMLVAERAAASGKEAAEAFAPIIERGLAALAAASEKGLAAQAEILAKLASLVTVAARDGAPGAKR